jgi:hypothetical protein
MGSSVLCLHWVAFLITWSTGRPYAVFKRLKRYGFTDTVYDVMGLREHVHIILLSQILLGIASVQVKFFLCLDRILVALAYKVVIMFCLNACFMRTGGLMS